MSQFELLLPQAAEVRDATLEGENTALRIGTLFVDLLQALASGLPSMTIDASSIRTKLVDGSFSVTFDVVSETGVTESKGITIPAATETSAGLLTPELLEAINTQLTSLAGIADDAASAAADATEKVSSLETTTTQLSELAGNAVSAAADATEKVSSLETTTTQLSELAGNAVSSAADAVAGVNLLFDFANALDERIVQLEALNIVPLVSVTGFSWALETSADLLRGIRPDLPGLQLVLDAHSSRIDFLVLVREDGSTVINPRPYAKKEGFGMPEFNNAYFYRFKNILFRVTESTKIRPVFLPGTDTESSISALSARMDRLEELSGSDASVDFDGATLAAINEALAKSDTAHSRALEALEAAGEAQEALASVSHMAEHVAPFLRYHALPVTAVRSEGCFDYDGPGIYLVPANDIYEWVNFQFGHINGQPGNPWDTWESPEEAQAWEDHWEAVKAALSLPYDLSLIDFGTVNDADDAMDANDGLYFSIEDQCYYRVTADGTICEAMLFPSDLEELTDEDIEEAARQALNSANNN